MKKIVSLLVLTLILAIAMCSCGEAETKSVSTNGSTSMEEVIGALGEQFQADNEGVQFTYDPTGSGTGITAVSEGRCDIGLSSRALTDEEKSSGLKETILALDGIAVIVNNENTVRNLSMDQIASIYKGEITNWSEVGGADGEIVVIGREAGSGTRDGFRECDGNRRELQIQPGAYLHGRCNCNGFSEPQRNRLCFCCIGRRHGESCDC